MSDNANVEVAKEALEALSIDEKSSPSNQEEKSPRKPRIPTAERIRLWEEEQKAKRVLSTGLQGKVKWYSVLRRYGFISRNDGEKDIFVHQTAIAKSDTEKFYLRTTSFSTSLKERMAQKLPTSPAQTEETLQDRGYFDYVDLVSQTVYRYRHKLLSRFRKNRKPRASVDGEESDNAEVKPEETKASTEKDEKPRKQRKNKNRKPKAQKKTGDAADSSAVTESSESAVGSPDSKACSKIIDEEAALSKIDQLGDAGLGAQQIDAEI
ncbi:Protein CBR-CEY-2 [Caenorhabditis briggsae]|uniref:Protein CBR-CEY-2 n=1 Tax=Caenorhabditis briggsae TaxID=6238 RepID=A8XKX3_CAEBR|nr:Protein CBR-CEY-2 [Caenorhabditis briggsae]CAP33297.2 Protein CBR-CEY-2 [Caenorhabditis briggsae]